MANCSPENGHVSVVLLVNVMMLSIFFLLFFKTLFFHRLFLLFAFVFLTIERKPALNLKIFRKQKLLHFLLKDFFFAILLNISAFSKKARTHLLSIKSAITSNANNNITHSHKLNGHLLQLISFVARCGPFALR